jgi:hypothetical protein
MATPILPVAAWSSLQRNNLSSFLIQAVASLYASALNEMNGLVTLLVTQTWSSYISNRLSYFIWRTRMMIIVAVSCDQANFNNFGPIIL